MSNVERSESTTAWTNYPLFLKKAMIVLSRAVATQNMLIYLCPEKNIIESDFHLVIAYSETKNSPDPVTTWTGSWNVSAYEA